MFSLFVLVILAIVSVVSSQAVGGWFPVDVSFSQVQEAAVFAVNYKYPGQNPTFTVVNAMKQVVAGLKFDITAEVTLAGKCQMDHYQVWNRFGTLTAVVSDTLSSPCGTSVTGTGPETQNNIAPSTEAHNVRLRKNSH